MTSSGWLPAARLRFAGWRSAGRRGRRSETACRGAGGGSCLAHSSAVGYGLRPSRDCAAVLGAQGFVARSRRSRPVLAADRTAPLMLLGPAARGDPGRLRASPLPRSRDRNPHPPRSATPRLAEVRTEECARAGERDHRSRGAYESRCDTTMARTRASESTRNRDTCVTATLACASASQCPFSKARRRCRAGWRGLPSRELGSGEARRCPGLPRAAGPRSMSGAVGRAVSTGLLRRDLATKPWAPSTERSRAKAERP